ncbi:MAG: LacI family DNA-binding transcriptional regulator [Lentisphaeria bacterium]|nr:LacI family DNA-binding transcriptional regulator [Lentisphaeria bacterium]
MATLTDIAQKTHFSVSTVSVVLRGESKRFGICAETEKTVCEAAAELGYVKNETARTMVSGKSRILGFISGQLSSVEYSGRLLSGALESASLAGYALRVFYYNNDPDCLCTTLLSQQIRGILISGDLGRDRADRIIETCTSREIHCVTVNLSNQRKGFGVVSDDAGGMSEMVDLLYRGGHRKITMLSSRVEAEYVQKRLNGYCAGMKKNGLPAKVFPTKRGEYPALSKLTEAGYTAVLCESDYIAARLMQQAYTAGIRVPEKISVCGFAGMQVADFAALPLTTVAQDFEGMGEKAAALLISVLENGTGPVRGKVKNISLPTRIQIQQTTKGI